MTVAELIRRLQAMPQHLEVVIDDTRGERDCEDPVHAPVCAKWGYGGPDERGYSKWMVIDPTGIPERIVL